MRRLKTDYLIHAVFLALFVYILIRAWTLSITHDEAITYKIIQGDPNQINTANHHWLNTLLAGITLHWFNVPEFGLRFPNVLAFIPFFYFSAGIVKSYVPPILLPIGLIVFTCNPFLLDYFSLARGYGISLGCMMAAIYFLIRLYNMGRMRPYIYFGLSGLSASLALLANLNTINLFLVLHGLLLLYLVLHDRKPRKRHLWYACTIVVAGIAFYYAIDRLFFLKNNEQLYFGVSSLSITLNYLITTSVYDKYGFKFSSVLRYALIAFLICAGIIALFREKRFNPLRLYTLLSLGALIALLLEHWLFDALYPIDRSSLYLYPLLSGVVFLGFSSFTQLFPHGWFRKSLIGIGYTLSGLYLYFALPAYNTSKCLTWTEFEHAKDGLMAVRNTITDNKIHTIENSWIYEPVINFYRQEYGLPLSEATRDTPSFQKEFVFLMNEKTDNPAYRLLKYYPEDQLSIYIRKH